MFIRLNRAFTVLELLLVLAIMTVLVSIVVFSLRPEDIFQTTNKLEIENDTKEIQTAYTTYKLNNDGNSPFGGDLISGMAYKICKEEITDCDINNFEVSLNPLKAARLLKNIPEIPDNEDLRYTGYVLSDVNGTSLSITTQTELVYSPENTTPGESFTYNGKSYTVIEGSSGSIWLDRNLGATSIPTNVSDANGFGTLYQFGRGTDGHEIRTSSLSVGPSGSTTPGSNFLTKAGAPFNWYSGTNPDNLWQGTSGINNPCPPTWRIPSQSEWVSEIASWSTQNAAGGFGSPLKLVSAGRRDNAGSVQEVGTAGYYWSYNTNAGLDTVKVIKITSSTAEGNTDDQRVEGMAVRCIKDEDAVFTPNSPTANFILTEDGLGECTGTVDINGIYKQGTALTASETVELSVFVVSPGAYSISTDLINGYSFTGTGTFNSTGNTTAILTNNNGTPLTDGVDTFTATLLGSNCTFSVDVDAYVPPPIYGTGLDGAVTLASNKNINTDTIATGRTCADGINYSVTALTTNSATLSTTPAAGCLAANDTVLLINLQGISTNYANTGNYELLTVQSATGTNVTFTSSKTKYYGNGASDDTNLGTATTNQRVMLQRVPNYTDVAINSGVSLTANAWDGIKGGVIAFKATGTTTVTGTIDADAKGFRGGPSRTGYYIVGQQGESHSNIGVQDRNPNSGGGGGGDKAGCPSYCYGAGGAAGGGYGTVGSDGGDGAYAADFGIQDRGLAGGIYGIDNLSKIYLGTGGGSGGTGNTSHTGGGGGTGGGIILLNSSQVTISGLIKSTGSNGSSGSPCSNYFPSAGGGASGGSILIYNNTINTGTNRITSLGGTSSSCAGATGGTGGFGRIAISGT
ncbi:hypothetical protein KBD45_06710, partial [Candidatus Dojkabacteria bacterium]|nr:hypothetical protein [Candidatus Dojkabacteria bacterium]